MTPTQPENRPDTAIRIIQVWSSVVEAARALVASEATRHDDTIAHDEWLRGNRAALDALTATVNALDAPEATDG